MLLSTLVYVPREARKPHGGFVLLTVEILYLLWWLYRQRYIRLRDLRVWLACQEMAARRCQCRPDQVPHYTLAELHTLVGGVGGPHLRVSLHRLEVLGLLTWSTTRITFATTPTALRTIPDLSNFSTRCASLPNVHRRVPVPRPTLRLLALGCRATVIATILGHLVRCLYYHTDPQRCVSGGWCKASWIAEVFQVDRRRVKAARRHLATLGWLELSAVPQRMLNRWGSYVYVNLTWEPTARATGGQPRTPAASAPTRVPPQPEFSTTQLPPLLTYTEPLQESQHQELAPRPCPLVLTSGPAPLPPPPPSPRLPASAAGALSSPTLSHMVPEDLQDTARLLTLFTQAQTQGLIGKSDSDRLTFVALAEHATVVGSTNPCGLFAALLHRQCWHFVTDSDEDAAHARLKHYIYGTPARAAPPPRDLVQPELSKDAAIVRYLQTQLARAGFAGDMFGLVSRDDASWTRARWDNAVRELEQAKCAWQQANSLNRLGDLTGVGEAVSPLGVSVAEGDAMA